MTMSKFSNVQYLTLFKSSKIITFSHLKSTNLNDNTKGNFMRENVNKMAYLRAWAQLKMNS